jgi:hypothetical protein
VFTRMKSRDSHDNKHIRRPHRKEGDEIADECNRPVLLAVAASATSERLTFSFLGVSTYN